MAVKNLLFALVCGGGLLLFAGSLGLSLGPAADSNSLRPEHLADDSVRSVRASVARIDACLAETWAEKQIAPALPAPDLAIARRMSLALTGTIPSLEELRHFEQRPVEHRLDTFLAERLADRRSADYLAERLARAFVGVEDGPFLVYRRRRFVAWLTDRIADNTPYDEIVRSLIAEQGLWTDKPSTNFITVTIDPNDGNRPDPDRLAARVARAFLGVRLDCAECHDHPFEPWKQQDFQALAAFFGGTRHSLRGIHDVTGAFQVESRQTGKLVTIVPAVPFQAELQPRRGPQRERLADWITHTDNRAFARVTVNRAWAILFGRPLVEPIDSIPLNAPLPPVLELLADDFVASGFDWRRLLQVIASTRAFRLDSRAPDAPEVDEGERQQRETHWAQFPLTRLRSEQVIGGLLQSASLATLDYESSILLRAGRAIGQREFIERYGDEGADEFEDRGGTIPQRLLMMNGKIVGEKTSDSLLGNAATQIAVLAPNDATAVETAFLAVFTRRPTPEEAGHFQDRLKGTTGRKRIERLGDLYWTLLNSTEFSWNH